MRQFIPVVKKSFVLLVMATHLFGYSAVMLGGFAVASEVPVSGTEAGATHAPCPEVNGTNSPTGASAYTFVLNPATCKWENTYYIWDPISKTYAKKYDQTPILNALGTAWEYTEWNFNPVTGEYQPALISIPVPVPVSVPTTGSQTPTSTSANTPSLPGISGANSQLVGGSTISGTGPDSSNQINNTGNFNGTINILNDVQLLTMLNSTATSGNAYVMQNTNGGNALTGDAEVIANYLNMIQSTWDPLHGNITVFEAGLFGDFFGDILFNPNAILNTGPSSDNTISNNTDTDLTVSVTENSGIQNDINLASVSGDATVSQNTTAGDATTGDATAIANIINMINSSLVSGQSFIGSLNIYGSLVGDLLLPDGIMDELRNTGPNSLNNIANSNDTNLDLTVERNSSITNNLDLSATSGNAVVDSNTNAGSATTGSASTSAQQINVIGQNTVGNKGLLVFMNVLGTWQGVLWDGTGTSSILGSGPNSTNLISNNNSTDITGNIVQNSSIINNINLDSLSGDALVSSNTNAGSARSGNASSAVNLLNMIDSNMVFNDWFGVLFINVFGNWHGSFGVDTVAGDSPPISVVPPTASSGAPPANQAGPSSAGSGNINNSGARNVRVGVVPQNLGTNPDEDISNQIALASSTSPGSGSGVTKGTSAIASTGDNQTVLETWAFLITFVALLGLLFRNRVVSLFSSVFSSAK